MPVVSQCGVIITRIQKAGIGRCMVAAMKSGRSQEQVERDVRILGAVANGSIASAAQRLGIATKSVSQVLERYEKYASGILEGNAAKGGGA